jgi:hypothetical protein
MEQNDSSFKAKSHYKTNMMATLTEVLPQDTGRNGCLHPTTRTHRELIAGV